MIVVIDGYNLLHQIFSKVKGKLDKQRDLLLSQLGFYKKQREQVKELIVVFDGGREKRATREVRNGLVIVFSGQQASADEWIIDYVDRNKDKELLLVTKDRGLIAKCRTGNIESISGDVFYSFVQDVLIDKSIAWKEEVALGDIQKYEQKSRINKQGENEALDLLMDQYSVDMQQKEELVAGQDIKRGFSHKKSKKERKKQVRLKKL